MKKYLFIATILLSFLFVSCFNTKYVSVIKEEEKSWGTEIYMARFDANNNLTSYVLMIPDSALKQNPTFYIRKFSSGNLQQAESVEEIENVTVGSKVYEGGSLKSIVINDKKYVKE